MPLVASVVCSILVRLHALREKGAISQAQARALKAFLIRSGAEAIAVRAQGAGPGRGGAEGADVRSAIRGGGRESRAAPVRAGARAFNAAGGSSGQQLGVHAPGRPVGRGRRRRGPRDRAPSAVVGAREAKAAANLPQRLPRAWPRASFLASPHSCRHCAHDSIAAWLWSPPARGGGAGLAQRILSSSLFPGDTAPEKVRLAAWLGLSHPRCAGDGVRGRCCPRPAPSTSG